MWLVLDTNVVASAFLWGGVPPLLLAAAREKRIGPFIGTPLLAELPDILGRRKLEQKISASGFSIDQLVDRCAKLAWLVRPAPIVRAAPDPDDDVVLGTALAAKVDLVVSGDKHLLGVGGAYHGIRIATQAEAGELIGR